MTGVYEYWMTARVADDTAPGPAQDGEITLSWGPAPGASSFKLYEVDWSSLTWWRRLRYRLSAWWLRLRGW